MYKIIGADRKEYGPVSVEELRRWIAEGRLNAQSLVQAEGTAEWKPLGAFAEFADALAAKAGPPPLIGPTPPGLSPEIIAADILARQAHIRIGDCLARSWRLLLDNFGLLFGATFLVWICEFVVEKATFGLGNFIITGVL